MTRSNSDKLTSFDDHVLQVARGLISQTKVQIDSLYNKWFCPYSQLRYDGYETAASTLAHAVSSFPPPSPSSRLAHLFQLGVQTEGEGWKNYWPYSELILDECFIV